MALGFVLLIAGVATALSLYARNAERIAAATTAVRTVAARVRDRVTARLAAAREAAAATGRHRPDHGGTWSMRAAGWGR